MVEDLFDVMDHYEIGPCVPGGECLDALRCLQAVLSEPERFRALVLVDGAPAAGEAAEPVQGTRHDSPGTVAAFIDSCVPEPEGGPLGERERDHDVALEDPPESAHVTRTDQSGEIFRGTCPTARSPTRERCSSASPASRARCRRMLLSTAGIDGPRDELTRYTTPLTGAYYFVPSVSALGTFATDPDEY